MALFQQYTYTNAATFFSDLASFGTANGWVASDLTTTTISLTKSGNKLNFSQGGNVLYVNGLVSGVLSGNCRTDNFFYQISSYRFFSSGKSLILHCYTNYFGAGGRYMMLGTIDRKVGTFANGVFISSNGDSNAFLRSTSWKASSSALFVDGSWATSWDNSNPRAGMLVGSGDYESCVSELCNYNFALVPFPVMIFRVHTNTSQRQPLGTADGVYRCSYGYDIYRLWDIITIGADQYVIGEDSYLFKLSV